MEPFQAYDPSATGGAYGGQAFSNNQPAYGNDAQSFGAGVHSRPAAAAPSGVPSQSTNGFDSFNGLSSNPMAAAGLNMGRQLFQNKVNTYIPGLTAFWRSLHFYFDLDNKFVLNRLKCLLFPMGHANWERSMTSRTLCRGGKYAPPRDDMNAPDLYIPLMSFITFVLVTGLLKGTNNGFTPEVLGDVLTASIVTQIIEIMLIKGGMWVLRTPSVPVLDMVAFTGYKYFGLTINTLAGLLAGSLLYYVCLLFTGGCMAYFMHKAISQAIDVNGSGMQQSNYVATGAAALQVLVMWWLGYSGEM